MDTLIKFEIIASGLYWIPQVIFGGLCLLRFVSYWFWIVNILSAFIGLFLPTLNAASVMMTTVAEAEAYYKTKTCC